MGRRSRILLHLEYLEIYKRSLLGKDQGGELNPFPVDSIVSVRQVRSSRECKAKQRAEEQAPGPSILKTGQRGEPVSVRK